MDAGIGRCELQMLRLESPGFALPGTVMSDLSLIRYGGFATLRESDSLRRRLESEQSEFLQTVFISSSRRQRMAASSLATVISTI